MIGFAALKKIFAEAIGWLGLETKYTRQKREQKELIDKTAKEVQELKDELSTFKAQAQKDIDMIAEDTNAKFDMLTTKIDEMMTVLNTHNEKQNKMIVGIGNSLIVSRCQEILSRGYIYTDEYTDLNEHLYVLYRDLGGNSSAEHFMNKILSLEVRER